MILYAHLGTTNYMLEPIRAVPINRREGWEFLACLTGEIAADLPEAQHDEALRGHTLWVFPNRHAHGWMADAPCERALFHFKRVPHLLAQRVPMRGYYRVPLSNQDCERLRAIATAAIEANRRPCQRIHLLSDSIVAELSLLALREVPPLPLPGQHMALNKTAQALSWYAEHMFERPTLDDVARGVYVSPAYLRRLFHQARGESPHKALNRLRMDRARSLLLNTDGTLDTIAEHVGFSSASALSRAFSTHFGTSPRQLRTRKDCARFRLASAPGCPG